MIKLTICLCGLLILGNAGQAVLSRYEAPGEYLLHEAVAAAAMYGKRLYMTALITEETEGDVSGLFMEQAATFLGWRAKEDTQLYVEDEYTRQELIEAGRGGGLSDIRRENAQAINGEEISQNNTAEINHRDGQDSDNEAGSTEKSSGVNEKDNNIMENNPKNNTEDQKDTVSGDEENTADNGTSINEITEEEPQRSLRVSDLATEERTMTSAQLLKKYFIVDPVTKADETLFSFTRLTEPELSIEKAKEGEKQILIYHTHSQEGFRDSVKDDADTTIVGVGTYLTRLLTEKGYHVLHLTDTFDLSGGTIDRDKAYTIARKKLKEIIAENPSLQVILDIHRDGVAENKRLVTVIDGRQTAKIMFFNGLSYKQSSGKLKNLSNPYIQDNLAFSFQAEYLCDYYYPSFSRCIYLKAYRYNLDLLPRSMLVEVGAQTNTVQEAKNAMIPLADVLHKLLQGA